MIKRNISGDVN